jgi:hypothetical protein
VVGRKTTKTNNNDGLLLFGRRMKNNGSMADKIIIDTQNEQKKFVPGAGGFMRD